MIIGYPAILEPVNNIPRAPKSFAIGLLVNQ
jgi:hypothetical protein